jgi:hypothetical protein
MGKKQFSFMKFKVIVEDSLIKIRAIPKLCTYGAPFSILTLKHFKGRVVLPQSVYEHIDVDSHSSVKLKTFNSNDCRERKHAYCLTERPLQSSKLNTKRLAYDQAFQKWLASFTHLKPQG